MKMLKIPMQYEYFYAFCTDGVRTGQNKTKITVLHSSEMTTIEVQRQSYNKRLNSVQTCLLHAYVQLQILVARLRTNRNASGDGGVGYGGVRQLDL